MGLGTEQTTDRNIAALVGRMADGFSKLVSQHIQLARAELGEDIRGMGMDVARIAMVVPFLLVGYLFLCGTVAALLAPLLGWAGALGLVSGVNLAVGGYLLYRSLTGLRSRNVMNDSAEELTRSVSAALTTIQGANAPAASTANTLVTPRPQTATTAQPTTAPAANVLQQAAPAKNVIQEQPHGR